jgi:YVTN family beta-propeller protein
MRRFRTHPRLVTIGLLAAGSLLLASGGALAQSPFGAVDAAADAQVRFAATERGKPILPGSEVQVSGQGFRPGQKVTLLYGTAALPNGTLEADKDGKIAGRITVPADAAVGSHPIVVVAQGPYSVALAPLKVSPSIPLSGQDRYITQEAKVARGLYQSAFSAKNNALFVTSAIGRPPVRQSELLKLNPDTLEVLARITPQPAPARPGGQDAGLYAVYGVGVDDGHDTVWVTNTRQDTVAVYRQSDLSLVKQFPPGTVSHARDVLIDPQLNKVFASAMLAPEVVVFDTRSNEVAARIEIASRVRGGTFSAASLSLDAAAYRLYVVSQVTNEVAVIDTRTNAVEKVLPVPGARGAIGVSHDPQTGRIFVSAQDSDNLVVLDGGTGKVLADTPVGAGALNVVFDPARRHGYVASRGAGTVTVVNADGKILANLGPAPLANHVLLGPRGTVYSVDKSAGVLEADSDTILRLQPR